MAEIEEGLVAFLLADPTVTALVGSRIEALIVPINAQRPAIAYQRITTPKREMAHDGPTGECLARIQLTCEGRDYKEAKAVAKACRKRLDGYRGLMGTNTVFQSWVSNDVDSYSQEAAAPVVRIDVHIQHRED